MSQNDNQPTQPIQVNSSNAPTTALALIGQLIPFIAGFVAAVAHINNQDAVALVTAAVALASACWRIYTARTVHAKLVTVATAADDSVAQVK